jgi:hypothetical protein
MEETSVRETNTDEQDDKDFELSSSDDWVDVEEELEEE